MSAVLLVAGATTLSGAVFVAVLSLQTLVSERRQAYRTIRALRAVEIRPIDIRDRELARPAKQRVITPFSRWALAIARRMQQPHKLRARSRPRVRRNRPA